MIDKTSERHWDLRTSSTKQIRQPSGCRGMRQGYFKISNSRHLEKDPLERTRRIKMKGLGNTGIILISKAALWRSFKRRTLYQGCSQIRSIRDSIAGLWQPQIERKLMKSHPVQLALVDKANFRYLETVKRQRGCVVSSYCSKLPGIYLTHTHTIPDTPVCTKDFSPCRTHARAAY
jgi:hypothetical protein